MTLQRWEPFSELRRMDRAMDETWNRLFEGFTEEWPIPLDIYRTRENVVVASIPGVKPWEMELTIEGKKP